VIQLWRSFGDLVPLLVVIIAALLVSLPVLSRFSAQRRRNGVWALMCGWLVALCAVTLLPAAGQRGRALDLIPLGSVVTMIRSAVDWEVPDAQIGGNTLLFVPLGLLLRALPTQREGSALRALEVGALLGLTIELGQYALAVGRVSSVDDVLLAACGTAIGWLFAGPLARVGWNGLRGTRTPTSPADTPPSV
jgi:glycopeptide antibiotics resistance protein